MSYPNDLLVPDDGALTGFSRVTTSAQGPEYAPGYEVTTKDGKRYRYTQFKDAVTYVAGHVVCWKTAACVSVTNDISLAVGVCPAGVCVGVPAENGYGWVQTYGPHATIKTSGADDIVIGESLIVHATTDGCCDGVAAGSTTTASFGTCLTDDINADNTVAGFIRL